MAKTLRTLIVRLALCAGVIASLTAGLPNSAHAQNGNQAVLILDHSGSMWARIEGVPKISVVRDAVKAMLQDNAGKIDLGVIAYGATKKTACKKVDTIKALGPIEPKTDARQIEQVKPGGSAAIALSLTEAGKLFSNSQGARSIIIVSDSTDDCEADPCATIETLKKQSPAIVAHVIAFSEQDTKPLEALSCIAKKTGGLFQTASSTSELNAALRKAFLAALNPLPTNNALTDPFGGASSDQKGQAVLSNDPGTLVLSALLSDGTEPLTSGLTWRIYSSDIQSDGSYKLLHRIDEARIAVTLPPADYLVNVAYGQAHATKRVTVLPGKRSIDTLNLQAGGLRLYATLAKQPVLADNVLSFNVYSEESDQFGNRRRVIAGARAGVVLRLNSGSYKVVSKYGDANAVMEVDVKVEPGKLTEATIDHQAGKVTFRLVERQGGEALADTIWQIYSGDDKLVKKSGGAFPSHILAAGNYSVHVEHGGQKFIAKFSVKAGDKQQVEVIKP